MTHRAADVPSTSELVERAANIRPILEQQAEETLAFAVCLQASLFPERAQQDIWGPNSDARIAGWPCPLQSHAAAVA